MRPRNQNLVLKWSFLIYTAICDAGPQFQPRDKMENKEPPGIKMVDPKPNESRGRPHILVAGTVP